MTQISEILKQYELSDVKATDKNGDTVLHLVVKNEKFTSKELIELLRILLKEGGDPLSSNKNGETILHLAIARRAKDVIEFLQTHNVRFEYSSLATYLIESEKNKTVDRKDESGLSDSEWRTLENESTSFVEWIISKGLNIDGEDGYGVSGFFFALDHSLLHLLPTLLKYTKDIDFVECNSRRTLLHTFFNYNGWVPQWYKKSHEKDWSSKYSQRYAAAVVKTMLDKGVSAEAVDVNGNTALHLALLKEESTTVIEILIERTSNVSMKNVDGEAPFHIAIRNWGYSREKRNDYMTICRALIAKGANVNEPNTDDGKHPLGTAFKGHHLEAVEFLREQGADFSTTTKKGESLLHLLIQKSYGKTDDEAKSKLFNMLINDGCNVNAKDKAGNTTLHKAAVNDDVAMVRKLIEHGATVHSRNNDGDTPLCYLAASNKSKDVARVLLEYGANINAKDFEGLTALHSTVVGHGYRERKVGMIEFLLKHGADFNARGHRGHSVLRMAIWNDYNEDFFSEEGVAIDQLPKLTRCLKDYSSAEVEILLKHWIKLHVAKLKCYTDNDYEDLIKKKKYKKYREKCLAEIETLKKTFIDSRTSFYAFLHMEVNSRRAYIYNEKLQQLVDSSKLEEQFPEFAVLIYSSYHQAVARKSLLNPAKAAWLELTRISLPEECIELIFSFFSDSELFDIIEKN